MFSVINLFVIISVLKMMNSYKLYPDVPTGFDRNDPQDYYDDLTKLNPWQLILDGKISRVRKGLITNRHKNSFESESLEGAIDTYKYDKYMNSTERELIKRINRTTRKCANIISKLTRTPCIDYIHKCSLKICKQEENEECDINIREDGSFRQCRNGLRCVGSVCCDENISCSKEIRLRRRTPPVYDMSNVVCYPGKGCAAFLNEGLYN